MAGFRLNARALRDVGEILTYLHAEVGAAAANKAEAMLFREFNKLALLPGLGRSRPDLTQKNMLFHPATPYIIAFRRSSGIVRVLRVLHGSRDIGSLL
jgi:plasmid stabilization system protein ParE